MNHTHRIDINENIIVELSELAFVVQKAVYDNHLCEQKSRVNELKSCSGHPPLPTLHHPQNHFIPQCDHASTPQDGLPPIYSGSTPRNRMRKHIIRNLAQTHHPLLQKQTPNRLPQSPPHRPPRDCLTPPCLIKHTRFRPPAGHWAIAFTVLH